MNGYDEHMSDDVKAKYAEEIAEHLKERLGISVNQFSPIDKGWLHVKWKMETNDDRIFVKFYHPDRYNLHTRPEKRNAIERTLQLQNELCTSGVPCPGVYEHKGQFMHQTPSGLYYAVLDWVDGRTAEAGCLSDAQMYELGLATGRMHKKLRSIPIVNKAAWSPDLNTYMKEWQMNREKAQMADDEIVMEWLKRSQAIVKSIDFSMFQSCTIGWLHWDLWVDNLMLHEQGLAGIVDFDRMAVAYQEIDVARAILSGALKDGGLRMDSVRAFMDGYREYSEVPSGMLTRAISMLYLIESIWWLRTDIRNKSELRGLLARFLEEIHWIEDNWEWLSNQNALDRMTFIS